MKQEGGEIPLTWEQAETVILPRKGERIMKSPVTKKEVCISFVQDRHTDPEIKVFAGSSAAIAYTRKRFAEVVAYPEDIQEYGLPPGWLLNLGYIESDRAFVVSCSVISNPETRAVIQRIAQ